MASFFICVLLLNIFAAVLILVRPAIFKTKLYRPMLKNIFLSIAPIIVIVITVAVTFFVLFLLKDTALMPIGFVVLAVGLFIWLMLLPNSGYLITELNFNHRSADAAEVPLYYDIISVLTLSMSGVMNTITNVVVIQILIAVLLSPETAVDFLIVQFHSLWFWLVITVLFLVISFGIYIGRNLRFNSWDIKHPVKLTKKIFSHMRVPEHGKNVIVFTVTHTIFFLIIYGVTALPLFL